MNDILIDAFVDELEKIGGAADSIVNATSKGKGLPGKLKYLKYPLMIGGGVAGWEQLKKMKRRYDIGSAYESQRG
jgi:hypothetical protein